MHGENLEQHNRRIRRLITLDIVAHGAAFMCCAIGGIVLKSVVLMAAASHHLATISFRLYGKECANDKIRSRPSDALFSGVQLVLWVSCLLVTMNAVALGAHGVFHSEPLDAKAMAGLAVPGAFAAVTTAVFTCQAVYAGMGRGKADAFLSGAPTALALIVAFGEWDSEAGRLDSLAGLATVLTLCTRVLMHLRRTLG